VKKPLMVLGTLPRVVGPGEKVKLPVTVFAMDRSVKNVRVEVIANEMFSITGGNTRQVSFSAIGDQLVAFDLDVQQMTGIGNVKIIATCGKLKAEHTIEIGVRNPNLPITDVLEKVIKPGDTWTTGFRALGIRGTNKGVLEISTIPPLNLDKRLSYLIRYPYGCIEQTVSSAFPQLYLAELLDLSESTKKETEFNIRGAIQRINVYQVSNGGFAYWPGEAYADDWATTYTGHFLLEAALKGYTIPVNLLKGWKEFQRQKAVSWNFNASFYNNDLMQAYRLYTLALAKAPELGAMNKLLEKKDLSIAARWQLAASYQLAGKREVALRLINSLSSTVAPYRELGYTYGSAMRDKAMIVEALCLLDMKTRAAPLVKEISLMLGKDYWYSTQETSFALMAVAKFSGEISGTGIRASFRLNAGQPESMESQKSMMTRKIDVRPENKGVLQLSNRGKNILFARLILTGTPAKGDTTSASNSLKMSMVFKSMTGTTIKPWLLPQGTNFIAEVTVTNPGLREPYQQLALSQVFPSGWEVINARSSDLAQSVATNSLFTYQDIRDDRVNTFFDLDPARTKTFSVMLMATYLGRFYLPSTGCEAMYDNTINARVPGRWVEVVPAIK